MGLLNKDGGRVQVASGRLFLPYAVLQGIGRDGVQGEVHSFQYPSYLSLGGYSTFGLEEFEITHMSSVPWNKFTSKTKSSRPHPGL